LSTTEEVNDHIDLVSRIQYPVSDLSIFGRRRIFIRKEDDLMVRKVALLTMVALLSMVAMAFAETNPQVAAAGLNVYFGVVLAAGLGIGIAALGTGIGQGLGLKGAVEGVARNPEASGKITVTMIIGLAMIESLCIYALVVSLILLYAYPMATPIAKMVGLPL
jgi:F-type H+-transporting ATPase subunit c